MIKDETYNIDIAYETVSTRFKNFNRWIEEIIVDIIESCKKVFEKAAEVSGQQRYSCDRKVDRSIDYGKYR